MGVYQIPQSDHNNIILDILLDITFICAYTIIKLLYQGGVILYMEKKFDMTYFDNLLKSSKSAKKQIAVYLDDVTVERLDMIAKLFSSISDSKSFSRNTLIETSVDKFLSESECYIREQLGVDVNSLIEEERAKKFDTVILSSTGRGFEETFLGEKEMSCWYPCRVSDAREHSLKFIAVYRGQPISAITHYAKIKEFKFDPDRNCKVCYFDGDPIELPNKIILGNKDSCYFIGPKYTSLEGLLNSTRADELNFG